MTSPAAAKASPSAGRYRADFIPDALPPRPADQWDRWQARPQAASPRRQTLADAQHLMTPQQPCGHTRQLVIRVDLRLPYRPSSKYSQTISSWSGTAMVSIAHSDRPSWRRGWHQQENAQAGPQRDMNEKVMLVQHRQQRQRHQRRRPSLYPAGHSGPDGDIFPVLASSRIRP